MVPGSKRHGWVDKRNAAPLSPKVPMVPGGDRNPVVVPIAGGSYGGCGR